MSSHDATDCLLSAYFKLPDLIRKDESVCSCLFFQPSVFGFGFAVDGNVRVGALPRIQESLVRLPRGGFVAHHLLRAAKLEPGQGSRDISHCKPGIVDQFLELRGGRPAIAEFQVRKSADVGGVHVVERVRRSEIVLGTGAEQIDGGCRIVLQQLDRGPDSQQCCRTDGVSSSSGTIRRASSNQSSHEPSCGTYKHVLSLHSDSRPNEHFAAFEQYKTEQLACFHQRE